MDVNDDFMSAHLRETNANMKEIDMAGPQFSTANEARFELTPPSIQKQFENEEQELLFKQFMEHNNVNLLLLLSLLSTNLYSAPNTPLTSGTLHTKHGHNTTNLDSDSLKILLLDIYKDAKGDWYLKDTVSSKTVKVSGAKKQLLSFATIKAARVRNTFQQTIPKYPFKANVVVRQQVENIEMEILHESATGAEIAQEIETVLDSDLLTLEQKKEMREIHENVMTLDAKVKGIRLSEQYFKSEKEKVQKQLEDAQKSKSDANIIKALKEELKQYETQEIIYRQSRLSFEERAKTQLERIKESFLEAIDSIPLRVRISELFRKERVTIASLITAIGMTITGIALAMKLTLIPGKPPGKPLPPPDKPPPPPAKSKIKDALLTLGDWLKDLASKSASAVPGLIASNVSFRLTKAGEVVGFFAEHLFILIIAIVGIFVDLVIRRPTVHSV